MKNKTHLQIKLALVAMGIIFIGTEMIVGYISKETYSFHQVRMWVTILIAIIYYVMATQISETTKNEDT